MCTPFTPGALTFRQYKVSGGDIDRAGRENNERILYRYRAVIKAKVSQLESENWGF